MMGDTNFQRVPWDEEETALLIEAYQQSKSESNRREIVAKLSRDLRGRAELEGIDLDDKFRNENGVSMRMAEIACLFGDEDNGMKKTSKLFKRMVSLYQNNKVQFDAILMEAKDMGIKMEAEMKNDELIIDFSVRQNYSYTKPVAASLFGKPLDVNSWNALYADVVRELYRLFPERIPIGMPISDSNRVDIGPKDGMIFPKQIDGDIYLECNASTTGIVNKIRSLLQACEVDVTNIEIRYIKKETKGKEAKKIYGRSYSVDSQQLKQIEAVIVNNYKNGFSFNSNSIRILSELVGEKITPALQKALKQEMYLVGEGEYFLPEQIGEEGLIESIKETASFYLDEFDFFEIDRMYDSVQFQLNTSCIQDLSAFRSFLSRLITGTKDCAAVGKSLLRKKSVSKEKMFTELTKRIEMWAKEDFGGVISEEDLTERIPCASIELLNYIIRNNSEELIKTTINGVICYETLEMIGFDNDFPELLEAVITELSDLHIAITSENLHTALSIRMGRNVKEEYNISDEKIFRKLIETYYQASPNRCWKNGLFSEAID